MTTKPPDEKGNTNRREWLALGAAAAGALAGVALTPRQANAHAGDPAVLHLGHGNLANAGTQLTGFTDVPTLHVTNTAGAPAVQGQNDQPPAAAGPTAGVHGLALHATGVLGHSLERVGVHGVTDGAPLPGEPVAGVHGVGTTAVGVLGYSGMRVGVAGQSDGNVIPDEPVAGVFGSAANAVGVLGFSENGTGVQATSPGGLALDVVGEARFSNGLQSGGPINAPAISMRRARVPVRAGVIPDRASTVTVTDGSVRPNRLILVNLTSNPGEGVGVSWVDVGEGGFVLHLTGRVRRATDFRYCVVG